MKKLLPFLGFVFAFVLANGQRDLQVKYYLPKYGDTLYLNESYTKAYGIINKGTTDVPASDSIFLRLKINGNYVLGAFEKRFVPHGVIKPGDSLYFTSQSIVTNFDPAPFLECFEVVISYNGVVLDSVAANNESCVLLRAMSRNTQGLLNPSAQRFNVYPNPAINSVRVLTEQLSNGRVVLKDVTGREVAAGPVINHEAFINTEALPTGIYYCFVFDTNPTNMGIQKVLISK